MALVVNLAAGPGAGKSTTASGVFFKLKTAGYNCELVTEYAKDATWDESNKKLENQIYILGKQYHRLWRVVPKVDIVVTDSPLFLTIVYGEHEPDSFRSLVLDLFHKNQNLVYFLERVKKYNPVGRNQSEQEARQIDAAVLNCLLDNNIAFETLQGDSDAVDHIVEDVATYMLMRENDLFA